MPRFRKKPVVIEAFLWLGDEVDGLERINVGKDKLGMNHWCLEISTSEGLMYAAQGDWIVTGVQGEKYPVKPDVFALTYELAE